MRYPKTCDPTICAAAEVTRYAIRGVAVVQHDGKTFLAATDGRKLSMVLATPEGDDHASGIYPVDAFVAAKRKTFRKTPEVSLSLNGKAVVRSTDSTQEFPAMEGRFLDVANVIPTREPVLFRFSLNAEFLAQLAKATGSECGGVELTIRDFGDGKPDSGPIEVRPIVAGQTVDNASFGIIMPIERK